MKIGVFDSGLGGLIFLKSMIKRLPQYKYIYLGDNARTPYGNRSQEMIYKFTEQAVDFLLAQDCQLVVIACNTASAEALRQIQQEYLPSHYPQRRVLGVIRPLVEKVLELPAQRIGVIGTKATIASKAYEKEIKKFKPDLAVYQKATPLLVPLIEEGWKNQLVLRKVLKTYLKELKLAQIDSLILGCTHYPLLRGVIKKVVGKKIKLVDSATATAAEARRLLLRSNLLAETKAKTGKHKFFVSDEPAWFQKVGARFLGKRIRSVQKV